MRIIHHGHQMQKLLLMMNAQTLWPPEESALFLKESFVLVCGETNSIYPTEQEWVTIIERGVSYLYEVTTPLTVNTDDTTQ